MNLQKPIFENKQHGPGGGIPLLKSLWEKYDSHCSFCRRELSSIPDIYIKLSYDTTNRKGKPVRRWWYVPIADVASTYRKEEEDESVTYRDAYLLISNRYYAPQEVTAVYVKRWQIEVFYRTVDSQTAIRGRKLRILLIWNCFLQQKPFCATQDGNAIRKAPKKPSPTAKW